MRRLLLIIVSTLMCMAAHGQNLKADQLPPLSLRFAWGADAGASIDMSNQEMSSIDFNMSFGLSYKWFKFAGIGAQAQIMTSNSSRSYPIFALVRTNFRDDWTRIFWEVKGGASLNYLENNRHRTGAFAGTGIGFLLATGPKFTTHLVLGYTFVQHKTNDDPATLSLKDVHYASLRIGVTF